MRKVSIAAMLCILSLAGCEDNIHNSTYVSAADVIRTSNDLDDATVALFKHLKPSDREECLDRAAVIPILMTARRNNVLYHCLSAADKRNQGA